MIIACIGKAGAGKDEFAKIAEQEFGVPRVAFADAIKEEVTEFLDKHEVCWEHRHLWGDQKDKEERLRMSHSCRPKGKRPLSKLLTTIGEYNNGWHYFTPRSLLQFWGSEYRRSIDPLYWVRAAEVKIRAKTHSVLSDLRFNNEVKMVQDMGGVTVRITRPDAITISNMTHASETELDGFVANHELLNTGTLEEYHNQIRNLLKEILHGQ